MKWFIPIFLMIFSINTIAQTREEILQQFMEERKIMMEQMIEMFQNDFESDSFFQSDVPDSLNSFGGKTLGNNFQIEEKEERDGSISIIITPQTENMSLDIQTKDNSIIITSEMKVEESNEQGEQRFKSFSKSSSSKVVNIPKGFTAKAPIVEGKGFKISLIPSSKVDSTSKKKYFKKKGMVPIGKMPGEDTL